MWTYNNTLTHFGVKGMRWGFRKAAMDEYRNLRKSGLNKDEARLKVETGIINKKKNIVDNALTITRETKNINATIALNRKNKQKIDLSSMTDQELRSKINRMNMEHQYKNFTQNQVSKGHAVVDRVLSVGGSALAVTASALSIALAIKQLKG